MADTRLQMLTKIGTQRNPIEETEYQKLLAEQGAPALAQQQQTQQLLDKQKAETGAFIGRYTTGLADARAAAESELGLPQLRENTQIAGQTARDVSRQIQDIPQTQRTIAKQVGISAPRLALRTASETAELQPAAETARRGLEDALAGQSFGETQYTQRIQDYARPLELEGSMLSDSLAREFSGYTQDRQNELTLTLQKMADGQAVTLAEIQRASELARGEADFERQKSLLAFQSDLGLSNEQQMKLRGLGSYYQKPSTANDGW